MLHRQDRDARHTQPGWVAMNDAHLVFVPVALCF